MQGKTIIIIWESMKSPWFFFFGGGEFLLLPYTFFLIICYWLCYLSSTVLYSFYIRNIWSNGWINSHHHSFWIWSFQGSKKLGKLGSIDKNAAAVIWCSWITGNLNILTIPLHNFSQEIRFRWQCFKVLKMWISLLEG